MSAQDRGVNASPALECSLQLLKLTVLPEAVGRERSYEVPLQGPETHTQLGLDE